MGDKPPALNARQLGKVLSRFGWKRQPHRGKGSHIRWERPLPGGGTEVTFVPYHGGRSLARDTMWDIIKQAGLDWDGKAKKGKGDFYEI